MGRERMVGTSVVGNYRSLMMMKLKTKFLCRNTVGLENTRLGIAVEMVY